MPTTTPHLKKPPRTQQFDALKDNPVHVGRYLYWYAGQVRPVFRWWNGTDWQYNRRKANITVIPTRGDMWAGAAERHPALELTYGPVTVFRAMPPKTGFKTRAASYAGVV